MHREMGTGRAAQGLMGVGGMLQSSARQNFSFWEKTKKNKKKNPANFCGVRAVVLGCSFSSPGRLSGSAQCPDRCKVSWQTASQPLPLSAF